MRARSVLIRRDQVVGDGELGLQVGCCHLGGDYSNYIVYEIQTLKCSSSTEDLSGEASGKACGKGSLDCEVLMSSSSLGVSTGTAGIGSNMSGRALV